jgi:lysophospholipase L1-like esterase
VAINVSNAAIDFQYFAGGVQKTLRYTVSTTTAQWLCLILSWSKSGDAMKVYVNGTKALATGTGLGTFAGLLHATYTRIGSLDTASGFMKGNLAHCILGNRPITDAEALIISRNFGTSKISILGDSISSADGSYAYYAVAGYPTISTIINHAVGGHTIIDNMDAQTLAAANDGAYKIIIQLGTNDNNAGDMTALQAKAEAKIVELKASNPAATIYWMNVLPRWTNTGGGTVVDKSNIRTAIAAACTAQSVTCWDTFSTPWITAAQTADGLHPNTAGHVAIAAQVLARL